MVILKPHFPHPFPLHVTLFFFAELHLLSFLLESDEKRAIPEAEGTCVIPEAEGSQEDQGDHRDQEEPKSSEVEGYINFHNFLQLQHLPHLFCPQNYIYFFFVSLEPQRGAIPCAIPEAEGSQEDQYGNKDQQEQKSSEVEG